MNKLLLGLVAPLLILSGCLGGAGSPAVEPPTSVEVPTPTTTLPGEPEDVPKYHPHDLWGDRATLLLFNDFQVTLGREPLKETFYEAGALVSGHIVFDTRADGDDANALDKADTVFQGTKALTVKVRWSKDAAQAQIPGLTFLYKPANSPHFTAIKNIPNGDEFQIPVGKGMADMPHQLKLSRWRFALQAYDPQFENLPTKVFLARGDAFVTITALNGGTTSLDPPHPYNFLHADERFAGDLTRTIDTVVLRTEQTGLAVLAGDTPWGWRVDAPHIVPWETHTVRAWLHWNHTGNADAVPRALQLVYTDASGPELKRPTAQTTGANWAYYEIPSPNGRGAPCHAWAIKTRWPISRAPYTLHYLRKAPMR
jgi:hypothetical protein